MADIAFPVTLKKGHDSICLNVSDPDFNDHWIIESKTNPEVNKIVTACVHNCYYYNLSL